jgi:tRNA (guanine37-N1)-methyltransferase
MQISIVSIFPEMVATVADFGVVGRASDSGLLTIACLNPRDFTDDAHRSVDDRPYGGGPGMVMKFEPAAAAIRKARRTMPAGCPVICLSPQGKVFDQVAAERLARLPGLILLAGRYEGIDERLVEAEVDEELSLGDFVLSGGEIAAMAVIDAVARLLPGVLGDEDSAPQDSFAKGLLDCPHFTRPAEVEGRRVPSVLLSGDHAEIARWRHKQALGRSYIRRPELVRKLNLDHEQKQLLDEFLEEQGSEAANEQSARQ